MTRRKINSKENKNVNVTETKNQVEFSDKLIERMKKILSNKIKVSGHWVDMYDIGNKEKFKSNYIKGRVQYWNKYVSI